MGVVMNLARISRLFRSNNCMIYGKKGSGKDMLTGNVIAYRKLPYVSNIDYGGDYYPLRFDLLDLGGNSYKTLLTGDICHYVYPYPEKADVYISDVGCYLPCQYNGDLNKRYPEFASFQGLIRQLADGALHCNSQALNRPWDKIREQSDTYILCRWCHVLFGGRLVIQRVTVYDDYEGACKRVRPFRVPMPLISPRGRSEVRIARQKFESQYGNVKSRLLIYRNRSHYNTRYFRDLFAGGSGS